MKDLDAGMRQATQIFWGTRQQQKLKQESAGKRDQGTRGSATGAGHMNGFLELVRTILLECGLPGATIHTRTRMQLPGYFRPDKKWDLIIVAEGELIAALEVKSQVGSIGNNCNNRSEEALGNGVDFFTAFREGAFKPSAKPWLGFLMVLEDSEDSRSAYKPREPHFHVFPEFRGASYIKRYEILLLKLIRERWYDGACLVTTNQVQGPTGVYSEPSPELTFHKLAESLLARVIAHVKTHPKLA